MRFMQTHPFVWFQDPNIEGKNKGMQIKLGAIISTSCLAPPPGDQISIDVSASLDSLVRSFWNGGKFPGTNANQPPQPLKCTTHFSAWLFLANECR